MRRKTALLLLLFPILVYGQNDLPKGSANLFPNNTTRGFFTLVTHDSIWVYDGMLFSIKPRWVKFKTLSEGSLRFRTEDVLSITFVPDSIREYPNAYTLETILKGRFQGSLLSYDEGQVTFFKNGRSVIYAPDNFFSLRFKKYRVPVRGHQRALLFAPTGFNLNKRELQIRSTMLVQNSIAYGFTDHFSAGMGLLGDAPFFHVRISSPKIFQFLHLSTGFMRHASPIEGGIGGHIAASVGTPDYFINIARFKNSGKIRDEKTSFQGTSFGGSFRVGGRKRLFAEYIYIDKNEEKNFFGAYPGQQQIITCGMGIFNSSGSFSFGLSAKGMEKESYRLYPAVTGDFLIQKKKHRRR